MLERPDYAALIAGHTIVLEMINSGDAGLPVVNQLLGVAQAALGAAGMSFAEFGPTGGRIIAATGAAQWALGRPVHIDDPEIARLLTGLRTQDVRTGGLSGELASQLHERGLGRMLVARAQIGGMVIGTLHAHYPAENSGRLTAGSTPLRPLAADPAENSGRLTAGSTPLRPLAADPKAVDQVEPEHHAVMAYLASCVAHMYGDRAGLPVNDDGRSVAALADGLAIVDRDGLVRLWNRAAERVTGRPATEMLNQPLPFPMPSPGRIIDHPLPEGRWLRVVSGGLPGSAASRVVTFRDITDQHRRDHDRDLFIAVTSHELRTPVTVIKGYAETLHGHWDSLTEPDRRQAARVIGQRAGELARLVERLLSTADEAGPVGGSPPVPFDLAQALRVAVADLPADLRRRLVVDLPDDLPKVLGDRASVVTVLTELATNADKYSTAGTPVELSAAADGRTVVFRVSDRGVGIRPEQVERVFDRFWQGESGDRRRYPGAGLGLYLVRKIVERQNGWVSLRPREKGGTVAEVRLPRG